MMSLDGQMRAMPAAGKAFPNMVFSASMIAPDCDPGTGGAGTFVARDFMLDRVADGTRLLQDKVAVLMQGEGMATP